MFERISRWCGVALLGTVLLAACSDDVSESPTVTVSTTSLSEVSATPELITPVGPGAVVDTVASNLDVPWSFDFAADGRVFVTERVGRVRVIDSNGLRAEPWAELPVFAQDEQIRPESGLMGIALAPDFSSTGHVYVLGTFWKRSQAPLPRLFDNVVRRIAGLFSKRESSPFENRVYRLTDRSGRGVDVEIVIDDLPANYYHAGGALAFGPDGMLYVAVGEALASRFTNDTELGSGKVLRYRPDGSIPADNPMAGSPVYASGLRNVQALAWHPTHKFLLATEHGPSFLPHEAGRSGMDELNLIKHGANYGWPAVAGKAADARFVDPLTEWSPAIAPAGLAFYTGAHADWRGNAFVGGLRGQQLRRIVFDSAHVAAGRLKVIREEPLLHNAHGRIRAVRMAPDGNLWITTSNRDGRGQPSPQNDFVLRVRPVPRTHVQVSTSRSSEAPSQ